MRKFSNHCSQLSIFSATFLQGCKLSFMECAKHTKCNVHIVWLLVEEIEMFFLVQTAIAKWIWRFKYWHNMYLKKIKLRKSIIFIDEIIMYELLKPNNLSIPLTWSRFRILVRQKNKEKIFEVFFCKYFIHPLKCP